jgi:asparagine synthetase B (glutamine-hydrolysing)
MQESVRTARDRTSRDVESGVRDWIVAATGAASFSEAESCRVAFEGTLYNRDELVPDATRQGLDDAAVLLRAYLQSGPAFVDRLRGAFAFAIWDDRSETLLGARDPVGIYPLFYTDTSGRTLFSTSIEALVHEPRVDSALNRAALADHLCSRWPDPGETFYTFVRRVPPGHALHDVNGHRRVYRYWDPAPLDRPVDWVERDELERFADLMTAAVNHGLDNGPGGIFLSGGLDSVSVAAVAADESKRRRMRELIALSIAFPHDVNEEEVQRGAAASLGLQHVLLPFYDAVGERGLLPGALEASAASPAPLFNVWEPAYRSLVEAGVNHGCRVIFTGGGGDEWLTVGPFLAADLLLRGDVVGLYRLWANVQRSYRLSRLVNLKGILWTFGLRPILSLAAEKFAPFALDAYRRRHKRELTPEWVAPDPDLRREILERPDENIASAARGFYIREGRMQLDHAIVSMEMEELFATGRRAGVAMRMPFWDADLVDFLYRTPPDLLNDGGRSKGLVRGMLDSRFPDLGFERHKKLLATNFFTYMMAQDGPEAWRTMKGPFALEDAGVVDKAHVHSLVEAAFGGKSPRQASIMWNLMSLEAWVRPRV